jgi:hypothetical protein
MSITSKCPVSELKIALSFDPNGLFAAERGGVHPIVRLAAEIVGLGVEIDPVFLAGDLAGREIVDILDPAGEISLFGVGQAAAFAQRRGDVVIAVFLDEAHQLGAVELVGVHALPMPWRCAGGSSRCPRLVNM